LSKDNQPVTLWVKLSALLVTALGTPKRQKELFGLSAQSVNFCAEDLSLESNTKILIGSAVAAVMSIILMLKVFTVLIAEHGKMDSLSLLLGCNYV
jgi:hypothetical protein